MREEKRRCPWGRFSRCWLHRRLSCYPCTECIFCHTIESRYTRYCTQHNKLECTTSVRLGTHERQTYLYALTSELWVSFVIWRNGPRYIWSAVYVAIFIAASEMTWWRSPSQNEGRNLKSIQFYVIIQHFVLGMIFIMFIGKPLNIKIYQVVVPL